MGNLPVNDPPKLSPPPCIFNLDNLNSKYLSFFSIDDLRTLLTKGFLFKDDFLKCRNENDQKQKYTGAESSTKTSTIENILAKMIITPKSLRMAAQHLVDKGMLNPAGMKGTKKWRN